MRVDSSLDQSQREAAVAWFEEGRGEQAVATELGASRSAVKRLCDRWRVRGRGALVAKPTKQSYSFEVKLEVVTRFLAGESKIDLASEYRISAPKLIETWARKYRAEGEEALRPKRKGRPPGTAPPQDSGKSELERLRCEVAYLRAENAYLGKLSALMEERRRRTR